MAILLWVYLENQANDVKNGVENVGNDMKNAVNDATNTNSRNMMN